MIEEARRFESIGILISETGLVLNRDCFPVALTLELAKVLVEGMIINARFYGSVKSTRAGSGGWRWWFWVWGLLLG